MTTWRCTADERRDEVLQRLSLYLTPDGRERPLTADEVVERTQLLDDLQSLNPHRMSNWHRRDPDDPSILRK